MSLLTDQVRVVYANLGALLRSGRRPPATCLGIIASIATNRQRERSPLSGMLQIMLCPRINHSF